eukprot:5716002-Alexandrium_andersonii.AAC.1
MVGLAALLNLVEAEGRMPVQAKSVVALVPKEGAKTPGELRPIGVLSKIYRVLVKIRHVAVKAWRNRKSRLRGW